MTNQLINKQTINTIQTLWAHHVPQKIIAEALNIKYATISMYCRSFKLQHSKLPTHALVAAILDPYAHTNNLASPKDIINQHLASGE